MPFGTIPSELIGNLTKYLSLTDVVILHSCGDSKTNMKLASAFVTFNVETARCDSYYIELDNSKYGKVSSLFYYIDEKHHEFSRLLTKIPNTAQKVVSRLPVNCPIPESVDLLVTQFLGKFAQFARPPGELEVHLESATVGDRFEYVTRAAMVSHEDDFTDHDGFVVHGTTRIRASNKKDHPKYAHIVGKVFPKCHHISSYNQAFGDWHHTICMTCKVKHSALFVKTPKGTLNNTIVPNTNEIRLRRIDPANVLKIIQTLGPSTREIVITNHEAEIAQMCKLGLLDKIPSTVAKVTFWIMNVVVGENEKSMFLGVEKIYPFVISIRLHKLTWGLKIRDFTGINECSYVIFDSQESKRDALQKYPRLSVHRDR